MGEAIESQAIRPATGGPLARWFAIQRILGALVGLVGVAMLPPLAIAWWDGDGLAPVFARTLGLCWILGFAMWFPVRHARHELRTRDGFVVVTLIWVTACLVAALPLMAPPAGLGYVDALFEATSGLTTTGATIMTGLDALPDSLKFYRQWLHFLGGMGIVILAVAVMPMLKIGGAQLFRAEITGVVKDPRLAPRIAETAKVLWLVYVALVAACALGYWIAGMTPFDAVTHAFSTVATAGFGNYDASLGHFDSPLIEVVAMVFMLLGGMNFALHYIAWSRASTRHYFEDAEFRAFIGIALAMVGIVTASLWFGGVLGFGESLRHGTFHVVASLTTAGLATTGFAAWPAHVALLLLLLAFVGGCSGSTTGGLKVMRVVIMYRQATREILQLIHPRGRFLVKLGEVSVPGQVLAAVTGFCMLYVLCFVVLTLVVAATGHDLLTSASAVAACLTNLGPGLGEVAANYAPLGPAATLVCTFAMVLGRLEVFTVLVLLSIAFWRE